MKAGHDARITLTRAPLENGSRPSVSYPFHAMAEVYRDSAAAGVITRMGRLGANEMKLLRDKGAVTFAQDKTSSVVHGMPGEAIRLDAATLVLSPDKMAAALAKLAKD